MIDLWERPVEVEKLMYLIPSVLQEHTAENNPPSLPLSPDVDDAPSFPLTRGPHFIHYDVDAKRLTHHKQVVVRQSHTITKISIIMIQMQPGYQLKTAVSAYIPPKNLQMAALCDSYNTKSRGLKKIYR